jgi:ectoine hydroxylase-related dioxygenase (phytanoyl-CoA dioxygenase family)
LSRVLALNAYFLDEGYALNSLHTIQINPGEEPQELHHDDAYCNVPRPRRPFSTAIMVALDPFTASNGATAIIPGSHLWPSGVTPEPSQIISAVCPQGSAVYFLGTLWHGGGRNTSTFPRQSLTVQYCQPWVRPTENMILAVDPRKLGEIDERIVRMMGYQVGRPFIGYVDGMGVRRGVERFVKWMRGEVDWSPRTFDRGSDGNSRL